MRHLDPETLVGTAVEGGQHPHLASCGRCREQVAALRRTFAALAAASELPSLPHGLSRWAVAYARCAFPERPRPHLLPLLASSAGPLAAVRAGTAPAAALYGNDRFQVDLRLEPRPTGARLHGQVVAVSESSPEPWKVTAVGPEGRIATVISDAWGEFRIEGEAACWGVSVVAERDGERLVVARFDGGEEPLDRR